MRKCKFGSFFGTWLNNPNKINIIKINNIFKSWVGAEVADFFIFFTYTDNG